MRSGSPATRSAADIVLLEDSFDVLPAAFAEGQRVLRGMTDNIKLFLTRTLSIVFLIFFTLLIGQEFPLTPSQNSILATLTVGVPSIALAVWARPGHTPRNLWKLIVQFVLPAAFMVSIISVAVYDFFLTLTDGNVEWSQAAVTTTMVSTLLLIVLFAQPPTDIWVGASSLNGDRRPAYLVGAMYLVYAVILLAPPLREFFDLRALPWSGYVMLAFIVAGWAVLVRWMWRKALGDRIWRYGQVSIGSVLDRLSSDGPPSKKGSPLGLDREGQ
jgi:cation-transporting ATPase E